MEYTATILLLCEFFFRNVHDHGARVDYPVKGHQSQRRERTRNRSGVEHPLRVELNAFTSTRDRKVQIPPRRQHATQAASEMEPGVRVNGVTVASEAKVLCCVQGGDTLERLVREVSEFGCVVAHEAQSIHLAPERSNVDDLHFSEDEEMRNEPVDPAADVYVPAWRPVINLTRDPEVHVEVVTAGAPCRRVAITRDGEQVCKSRFESEGRFGTAEPNEIATVPGKAPNRAHCRGRIDAVGPTHGQCASREVGNVHGSGRIGGLPPRSIVIEQVERGSDPWSHSCALRNPHSGVRRPRGPAAMEVHPSGQTC